MLRHCWTVWRRWKLGDNHMSSGVHAMLARVARLEQARIAPRSPFEVYYGSMNAFTDKVQVDVAAGKLDGIDMAMVLAALHRWHRDQVWSGWRYHRNGMSEYGAQ